MSIKIKNFAKIGFSALLFCICVSFTARSQVTIGSTALPLKGTLLDLKEDVKDDGSDNSNKGMMLPRVVLSAIDNLSPMLSGSDVTDETLKPSYTGLVVYNVGIVPPFEKGMYIWDGAKWNKMNISSLTSVKARNGLTVAGIDTVLLGGDLVENTIINLGDSNLIFTRDQGKIGIDTIAPQAVLHIANPDSIDPLILRNVKLVTEPRNPIDGADTDPAPTYYDLKISEKGVLRKIQPAATSINQSFGYDLAHSTPVLDGNDALGGALGGGGSALDWVPSTGSGVSNIITLPEDGAYVFSFNLYGTYVVNVGQTGGVADPGGATLTGSDVNSFYISAFKNSTGSTTDTPVDIAEIVAIHTPWNYTSLHAISYSINLTVMGKAGDKINFKISGFYPRNQRFTWTLSDGVTNSDGGKTSMVYWRL